MDSNTIASLKTIYWYHSRNSSEGFRLQVASLNEANAACTVDHLSSGGPVLKAPTSPNRSRRALLAASIAAILLGLAMLILSPSVDAPTEQSLRRGEPIRHRFVQRPRSQGEMPSLFDGVTIQEEGSTVGQFRPLRGFLYQNDYWGTPELVISPRSSYAPNSFYQMTNNTGFSIIGVGGKMLNEVDEETLWQNLTGEVVNVQVIGHIGGQNVDGLPERAVATTFELMQSVHEGDLNNMDPLEYHPMALGETTRFYNENHQKDAWRENFDNPRLHPEAFFFDDLDPFAEAVGHGNLFDALKAGEDAPPLPDDHGLSQEQVDEMYATYEVWIERRRGFMENGPNYAYTDMPEHAVVYDGGEPPPPPPESDD